MTPSCIKQEIVHFLMLEFKNGYFSTISATDIGVTSQEFLKACQELKEDGIINFVHFDQKADTLSGKILNIRFTDVAIAALKLQ